MCFVTCCRSSYESTTHIQGLEYFIVSRLAGSAYSIPRAAQQPPPAALFPLPSRSGSQTKHQGRFDILRGNYLATVVGPLVRNIGVLYSTHVCGDCLVTFLICLWHSISYPAPPLLNICAQRN
ncbi:hypothetical protein OPQ81_005746 [Rhizoctonia solani]|nr:hypothetical protein OPQ81_005746 [Rhizoctonia solani]